MFRTRITKAGFSLLEMLAVITVMGVLAAIVMPRLTSHNATAKRAACHSQRGNLEVQAQLWYRNKGVWPNGNFSDMAADTNYLPGGLPTCPVDGSAYVFDSATQQVIGHAH